MPQFNPGQSKNAVVPVTVQPSGLSCEIEVFLGPNDTTKVATSGLLPFTSTGSQQGIVAPITMPSVSGTYHVFIDVYSEDFLIAAYQAIEDVVIAPVGVAEFAYVSSIRLTGERPYIAGGYVDGYAVDIQNVGAVSGVCTINVFYKYYLSNRWFTYPLEGYLFRVMSLSLEPGQIGTFLWWNYNYNENRSISQMTTWVESEAGRSENFRR